MQLTVEPFTVTKRFPLRISRGTTAQTTNLWLRLTADGITGWGEITPFSITKGGKKDTDQLLAEINSIQPFLQNFHPLDRQVISGLLEKWQVSSAVCGGINLSLLDWLGKRANLPLWCMWGLNANHLVPTSVTVGIDTPEGAEKRVKNWVSAFQPKIVKIKLGNPLGIAADQAMFLAVRNAVPSLQLTVDANGGWSIADAIVMSDWLKDYGVAYLEQPLAAEDEKNFETLYRRSPLPIFADESCKTSRDIPRLASYVDGINIKLMKAGGLSEAKRMVQVARACGLKIMFGCYSDSSLANTALCHLAPWADYLDLDSHLNLIDDPFMGVRYDEGRLYLNDLPGLGVTSRLPSN